MNKFSPADNFDWSPFTIGTPIKTRPMNTFLGLVDRIRIAAFAERQAYYAFLEAARIFTDEVPKELVENWKRIAEEEAKHEKWLLNRMVELGEDISEMPVSLGLYQSFSKCESAKDFAYYISDSEERGRVAGLKFAEYLKINDPVTSKIFSDIALEEVAHVALAKEFFE